VVNLYLSEYFIYSPDWYAFGCAGGLLSVWSFSEQLWFSLLLCLPWSDEESSLPA